MSSSTDFRPAIKQKTVKAAIIRPVQRREGQQTFIRIDAAQDAVSSNIRAVQLEDYVAQIRGNHQSIVAESDTPSDQPVAKKGRVLRDTARQQLNSSAELTEADHLQILKAVAKIDAGYQWIDERNRITASAATDFAEAPELAEVEQTQAAPVESVSEVSEELIQDIAIAIASVLTRRPESELGEKIANEQSAPIEPVIEPEPESVSFHDFPVREPSVGQQLPPASHTISLSAAAWDVPQFHWTDVSDRILAAHTVTGGLAENCESMLSPFGKTIAVTSPTRGQGTTTMSMTLARLFASCGKRVLLIDADIMQPRLSPMIGLQGISWFNNSTSSEPVGECIIHGKNSGICVMPLAGAITNTAPDEGPLFDRLEAHVNQVRGEFDLIVIDAGPVWQIVDEISSDNQLIDAAMLVNQDMHSHGFTAARQKLMDCGVYRFIAAQNGFTRRAA